MLMFDGTGYFKKSVKPVATGNVLGSVFHRNSLISGEGDNMVANMNKKQKRFYLIVLLIMNQNPP